MRRALGTAGTTGVCVHLAASVLQNTPESFNQDLRPFTGGWPLPGWRFFAPNPGIQNVHLLVREQGADGTPTDWRDITPAMRHGVLSVLWNPGSRGPKALFDAMQQLSVLSSNLAEFAWVVQSPPYELVESAARANASAPSATMQFLLMNVFPTEAMEQRMKPILVSEWFAGGASR